jgi:hypothetical protein
MLESRRVLYAPKCVGGDIGQESLGMAGHCAGTAHNGRVGIEEF